MKNSDIRGEFIKLSQWLKKEGLISTGGEAKPLIESGAVTVNGNVVSEIRKKLHDGDIVAVSGTEPYLLHVIDEA